MAEKTVTEEQVKKLIAEAIKGLVTHEQLHAALEDVFNQVNAATLEVAAEPGGQTAPPLDPAWLDGLTLTGATFKREIVDGRPRNVATPFTRPLTPADVLGYRVAADVVHLVASDGQKHIVTI